MIRFTAHYRMYNFLSVFQVVHESARFLVISKPKCLINLTAECWTAYLRSQLDSSPSLRPDRLLHVLFCTSRPADEELFLDELVSIPIPDRLEVLTDCGVCH